jgi:monoamine oxidase
MTHPRAGAGVGVLATFTNRARRPRAWVIEDEARRRSGFLGTVDVAFGPDAPNPVAHVERRWPGQRWTYGCGNPLQPGVLSQFGD